MTGLRWDALTHRNVRAYRFRLLRVMRPLHALLERVLGAARSGPGDFYLRRHELLAEVLAPGATLLECGAGSGELSAFLHDMYGCRTIGCDLSFGMVRDAARALPDTPFVQADLLRLPFRDGCVDATLAAMVLHHLPVPERPQAIAELRRVAQWAAFVQDLHSFDHPLLRALYGVYYRLADGSQWRPTLEGWLTSLAPLAVRVATTPRRNLNLRLCFFALPAQPPLRSARTG
jgi:ubiquinone/menaquinone biosynthesis C-methylase UbiE